MKITKSVPVFEGQKMVTLC